MIIVIVKFKISTEIDTDDLKKMFIETSTLYKDVSGLIRKNYIADTHKNIAGGIYTFDSMESAKNWFDDNRIKWIADRYSNPEIEYFESHVMVDNEKKKIFS